MRDSGDTRREWITFPLRGVSSKSRVCACILSVLMCLSFEVYCMEINLVCIPFLTGAKNLSMLQKLRYL